MPVKWNLDNSYTKLPAHFYSKQAPSPVRSPRLVIFNHALAASLGVPPEPEVFAGNAIPEGSQPIAQAYAGHQFGYFTMLGDGRALLLGEQITSSCERFDIQLKGSGRTIYSRGGDGRAALGPMLREYVMSEAMHALGIPTTRSLAVAATGETVRREKNLPGAILTRVASSHIRVGTFQYAARFGTPEDVRRLADYTIERHFPGLTYPQMLREAINRQALLIARWQLIGFIHGVMNTDNMAVSGETIDYGPCAFMDAYHPATVFSSIDTQGRYAFEKQPKMAAWNLARFAETLLPLLHENQDEAVRIAQEEIVGFWALHENYWLAGMRAKLGLLEAQAEDEALIDELLELMQQTRADYTNTFRSLTLGGELGPAFAHWHEKWRQRPIEQALMKRNNPAVIPRNHRMEEALAAAGQGDLSLIEQFQNALRDPYEYTQSQEEYAKLPAGAACGYRTFCGT